MLDMNDVAACSVADLLKKEWNTLEPATVAKYHLNNLVRLKGIDGYHEFPGLSRLHPDVKVRKWIGPLFEVFRIFVSLPTISWMPFIKAVGADPQTNIEIITGIIIRRIYLEDV